MSKLKILDDSINYPATVIKLPVKQVVNGLDNLVTVNVFGNDCLINKDADENEPYIYFPAGSQLSHLFCHHNNLYRDAALNFDRTKSGFFEINGRVKGIKLRGIISNGFVTPLTNLKNVPDLANVNLAIGDEFNEVDDVAICRKYIPPNTVKESIPKNKKEKINSKLKDILIPTQFRFHAETNHLAKNLHIINPQDLIAITDKWHGSSCILSFVYVNKRLNLAQKLWNKLPKLPKFATRKLAYIYSSGKPKSNLPKGVVDIWKNNGFDYYEANIWENAYNNYKEKLLEGITLYGELVGYTPTGKYIQPSYDYKCSIGYNRFVVYRITWTSPSGHFIEFTWNQIKDFCKNYDLEHVKELYYGLAKDLYPDIPYDNQELWREQFFNRLQESFNLEKPCDECNNKVPAEGIVLRQDGFLNKYNAYKLKSKLFVYGETNATETNIEDEQ